MSKAPQRIHEVYAKDFKGLTEVRIKAGPLAVTLSGPNGSGKSSILDAISAAIEYRAAGNSKPIREGATRSEIRVSVGGEDVELIVVRTFKMAPDGKVTTALEVLTKDGLPMRKPTQVLDSLMGDLSFDPTVFMRATARDQVSALRRFVKDKDGNVLDFDKLDQRAKAVFDERTIVGREVDRLQGAVDKFEVPGIPTDIDSLDTLYVELESANDTNRHADRAEMEQRNRSNRADMLTQQAKRDEEEAARLTAAATRAREEASKLLIQDDAAPARVDLTDLQRRIAAARSHASALEQRKRLEELQAQLAEKKAAQAALTARLQAQRDSVADAIRLSKMPVDGLGISPEGDAVLYNGLPFRDSVNDARRMMISAVIAMESNPNLRVIRITDASLFDHSTMAAVLEEAGRRGYQVWLERVSEDQAPGPGIVLMHEGTAVSSDEEASEFDLDV